MCVGHGGGHREGVWVTGAPGAWATQTRSRDCSVGRTLKCVPPADGPQAPRVGTPRGGFPLRRNAGIRGNHCRSLNDLTVRFNSSTNFSLKN